MSGDSQVAHNAQPTLLIAGLGKIGQKVCAALNKQFNIIGLKRSPIELAGLNTLISTNLLDSNTLGTRLQEDLPNGADYLLYCLSPSSRTEEGYRDIYVKGLKNLLGAIPNLSRLKRLIFISSSSVYAQDDHSWVNEQSHCEPKSFSGKILLEAESIAQQLNQASTIVRFSGIYGGNRTQLIEKVRDAAESRIPILSNKVRLSNRIHEDDCVGFIAHLLQLSEKGEHVEPLYLASDSEPADLNDVMSYIAKQLDMTLTEEKSDGDTRRGGNKKCSNSKMLESGYELKYPSYLEGYRFITHDCDKEKPIRKQ